MLKMAFTCSPPLKVLQIFHKFNCWTKDVSYFAVIFILGVCALDASSFYIILVYSECWTKTKPNKTRSKSTMWLDRPLSVCFSPTLRAHIYSNVAELQIKLFSFKCFFFSVSLTRGHNVFIGLAPQWVQPKTCLTYCVF